MRYIVIYYGSIGSFRQGIEWIGSFPPRRTHQAFLLLMSIEKESGSNTFQPRFDNVSFQVIVHEIRYRHVTRRF